MTLSIAFETFSLYVSHRINVNLLIIINHRWLEGERKQQQQHMVATRVRIWMKVKWIMMIMWSRTHTKSGIMFLKSWKSIIEENIWKRNGFNKTSAIWNGLKSNNKMRWESWKEGKQTKIHNIHPEMTTTKFNKEKREEKSIK